MDIDALKDRLLERENELTEIRWSVPYGYLKTIKQLNKVGRVLDLVETRLRARRALVMDERFKNQINIAFRSWRNRKRFLSLDVERTEAGEFQEVGVTLVQGSSIETFNYRVKGIERGPKFIFGTSIVADLDYIRTMILMHANNADYYIGNDFRHDLNHLIAEGIGLPRKFFYDTSDWGKAIKGFRPSLYVLTQELGVGSTQMHCGGNDSRYTAEVFLKMIHTYAVDAQ